MDCVCYISSLKRLCHGWIVHFFIDASCMSVLAAMKLEKLLLNCKITSILSNFANNLRQVWPSSLPFIFVVAFILSFNVLGPVPRKVVKFNQRLRQISSKVFSSKNMQLEFTKYCWAFTTRYSNYNTKCYSKQCKGMENTKTEQNFKPGLMLIGLCGYFNVHWF